MVEINPQEFGRMQAELQGLRRDNDEQMKLLQSLVADVGAIKIQLAEAKGGWKVLVAIGGAAGGLGALITTLLSGPKP